MSQYSDITLIECNRKQSTQKETLSNNSIWTNRIGNVVDLNIGDQISIEAGFINQRGCANPSSIEFKGRSLGVEGTFNYSQDNIPEINSFNNPTLKNIENSFSSIIFRNKTNKDKKIELKDNEVNIEVSFYKNLNGENHILLPRKHLNNIGAAGYGATTADKFFTTTDRSQDHNTSNHTYNLGVNTGRPFYFPETYDQTRPNFVPNRSVDLSFFNPNDYNVFIKESFPASSYISQSHLPNNTNLSIANKKCISIRPRIDNSRMTMFSRDFFFTQYTNEISIEIPNDNGVGTTTLTPIQYWTGANQGSITKFIWRYIPAKGLSPAFFEYSENKDLMTLKLNKGFQSPQSIAEQLTQQLQEETEDSPEKFHSISPLGFTTPLSYNIKTRTFKTYDSANFEDFSYDNFREFSVSKNANASSFMFNRTFNNIFVKRADLFTAGRAINNWYGYTGYTKTENGNKVYYDNFDYDADNGTYRHMGKPNFIKNEIVYESDSNGAFFGNYSSPIATSWEWNDLNLKRLNDLFKVQGNYPELFKNMNTDNEAENTIWRNFVKDGNDSHGQPIGTITHPTIDNARFLHLNRFNYEQTHYYWLGDDGEHQHAYRQTIDPTYPNAGFNVDHRSLPIFFKYQPENADKYINSPDINNLCYGFATRYTEGGVDYIQIHPEAPHSQGFSPAFFEHRSGFYPYNASTGSFRSGSISPNTTIIGWDYSFNSWGNVCMLGHTGINQKTLDGEFELGIGSDFNDIGSSSLKIEKIKNSVIGANNPAIVFDSISGKFGFKDLHMPEKIGQKYNAGKTSTIAGTNPPIAQSVPIVADASSECYKINKRLHGGSFCPDLDGDKYEEEGNTEAINASKNNVMTFTFFNSRVSPFTIFDSHMGVNLNLGNTFKISDINKQPEIWKNGLMGLLGFSYDQFNPKNLNENNRGDARVDFRNILSLHKPTTNCEVLNTDIQNYSMNPYGGIQYNPIIPFPLIIPHFYGAGGTPNKTDATYFPPIIQDTKSITILAESLPKLVQRPYLTIRSDIISSNKYIGGSNSGLNLPIISVINKINADKDFIQVAETSFNYTITRPTKLSEITTAITNPDGTLADTEDGNAIIYKLTRKGDLTNFDIVAQILNKKK